MSIVSTANQIVSKGMTSGIKFADNIKKITGQLNKIAVREMKCEKLEYTFSKATPEDLRRLTSKSIKDSYKRVTWTNPKDNKVYHILEEGRKNGKVQVRILDKDGDFIKNAELEPKTIMIFDNFFSPRGFTHGEMMETFVKRFNPFANVERLEHKKGLFEAIKYRGELPLHLELKRFKELAQKMDKGKKVDYISISEATLVRPEESLMNKSGKEQQKCIAHSTDLIELRPVFEKILSKGTRILESAGNNSKYPAEFVNDRLAIEGVEGVGSLVNGKIAKDSCSRNSVFTQHYEQRTFHATVTKDNNGKIVVMPVTWKNKHLAGRNVGGTSYSTPIRVAKLALNDMMEGIL